MKFCVVFATIVAVSFGAAIHDTSLKNDLEELSALIPQKEMSDLFLYYWNNDAEFKSLVMSKEWVTLNELFMEQPEIKEFIDWISNQFNSENNNIMKLALILNEHHKPGFKGFMEEYIALMPMDKISSFIQEKVAEGGAFAEFWSRVQALRPAYERFIRLPEVIEAAKRLEAFGFDGVQYDSLVRDQLGWH